MHKIVYLGRSISLSSSSLYHQNETNYGAELLVEKEFDNWDCISKATSHHLTLFQQQRGQVSSIKD